MPDSVLGRVALEIGGGVTGGGSPSSLSSGMGGNGADKAVQEQVGLLSEMRKSSGKVAQVMGGQARWWGKALKTMGIQVGLAGILKQSQIFTSSLGSIFQILGAFIDVMLAPWLPVIVPLIRWMARGIPKWADMNQRFFERVSSKWWPNIQQWFSNIKSKDWWVSWVTTAVRDLLPTWLGGNAKGTEPGKGAIDYLREFLPKWMGGTGGGGGGEGNGLKIPFLSDIADKLGSLGKLATSITVLGAVFVGAKFIRYMTAVASHLPLIGGLFKPFHIITRFLDEMAHLTIRLIMPGRTMSVWDDIVNTLRAIVGWKKKVPTPRGGPPEALDELEGRNRGGTNRGRPGGRPGGGRPGAGSPRVGNPLYRNWANMGDDVGDASRFTRATSGTGRVVTGVDDAMQRLYDMEEASDVRGAKQAQNIADRGKSPQAKATNKARQLMGEFDTFITSFIRRAKEVMKTGKITEGFKTLIRQGVSLAQRTMKAATGTPFAAWVARLGGKFAKWLPGIGSAFILAETHFSAEQVRKADIPWFGDLTSGKAHLKEFGGMAARTAELMVKYGPTGSPMAGNIMSKGPLGDVMNYLKGQQEEGGSLWSGKGIDYAALQASGNIAAGLSFVPGLNIPATAMFEATKYATVGGANPNIFSQDKWIGGRQVKGPLGDVSKYPERDIYQAGGEKIMQMWQMFRAIEQAQNENINPGAGSSRLKVDIIGVGNGNGFMDNE